MAALGVSHLLSAPGGYCGGGWHFARKVPGRRSRFLASLRNDSVCEVGGTGVCGVFSGRSRFLASLRNDVMA